MEIKLSASPLDIQFFNENNIDKARIWEKVCTSSIRLRLVELNAPSDVIHTYQTMGYRPTSITIDISPFTNKETIMREYKEASHSTKN